MGRRWATSRSAEWRARSPRGRSSWSVLRFLYSLVRWLPLQAVGMRWSRRCFHLLLLLLPLLRPLLPLRRRRPEGPLRAVCCVVCGRLCAPRRRCSPQWAAVRSWFGARRTGSSATSWPSPSSVSRQTSQRRLCSNLIFLSAFACLAAANISNASPLTVDTIGGTTVTLTGINFGQVCTSSPFSRCPSSWKLFFFGRTRPSCGTEGRSGPSQCRRSEIALRAPAVSLPECLFLRESRVVTHGPALFGACLQTDRGPLQIDRVLRRRLHPDLGRLRRPGRETACPQSLRLPWC